MNWLNWWSILTCWNCLVELISGLWQHSWQLPLWLVECKGWSRVDLFVYCWGSYFDTALWVVLLARNEQRQEEQPWDSRSKSQQPCRFKVQPRIASGSRMLPSGGSSWFVWVHELSTDELSINLVHERAAELGTAASWPFRFWTCFGSIYWIFACWPAHSSFWEVLCEFDQRPHCFGILHVGKSEQWLESGC